VSISKDRGVSVIWMKIRGLNEEWWLESGFYSNLGLNWNFTKSQGYLQGSEIFQGFSELFLYWKFGELGLRTIDHSGARSMADRSPWTAMKLTGARPMTALVTGRLPRWLRGLEGGTPRLTGSKN
jgi:hypothetical protein